MQRTFEINKKTINVYYDKDCNKYSLPTLVSVDKLGRSNYWSIYTIDNKIYSFSQIDNGKIKSFSPVETFGKNIGKKNETSDQDQAIFQSYSKWSKKHDQGYTSVYCDSIKTHTNNVETKKSSMLTCKLPMLAQKYDERGVKYLNVPFGVSRKLDGIRMIAFKEGQEIIFLSRLGKPFVFLNRIREQLETIFLRYPHIILDGELYSHDLPFNMISGVTRTKKKPSDHDDKIEYWIFDIADESQTYKSRMNLLKNIKRDYEFEHKHAHRNLKFEFYETCDHDHVNEFHEIYVAQGFEGVILRNLDGKYKFKYRTNDLMKYKDFEDKEFEVVDYCGGKGSEENAIIYKCFDPVTEEVFDVRPRGTIESRKQKYEEGHKYVGKMLTVRFQKTGIDDNSLPRFPVGIEIRDYE